MNQLNGCEELNLLTTKDMAKILKCCTKSILNWNASGRILKASQVGRSLLWRKDDVIAWQKAGCPNAEEWEKLKADQLTEV
jgi:hypothetical protein